MPFPRIPSRRSQAPDTSPGPHREFPEARHGSLRTALRGRDGLPIRSPGGYDGGMMPEAVMPENTSAHDPIVVYTMGKVGSQAVHSSLRALGLPNPLYHAQYFCEHNVAE